MRLFLLAHEREKFDEALPTVLYVFIVILVERTGSKRFEAINFFCARDAEIFRLNKRFYNLAFGRGKKFFRLILQVEKEQCFNERLWAEVDDEDKSPIVNP